MNQTAINRIKLLITVKITAIVFLSLLVLLWHNSLSPIFMFLVLLFAIGAITDYIAYTTLKLINKNLEAIYEKYEKAHHKH